jgi:hypothetical protein
MEYMLFALCLAGNAACVSDNARIYSAIEAHKGVDQPWQGLLK